MKKIIRIIISGVILNLFALLLLQLAISNKPAKAAPWQSNQAGSLCSSPGSTIPDGGSITDMIFPDFEGMIEDLDVYLDIAHAPIGDLVITLENTSTPPITIINHPNGTSGSCIGQNISNFADDDVITSFNDSCADSNPAFPPNERYKPLMPLGNFFGDLIKDTWTLTITDDAGGGQGTLNRWCLFPKLETLYTPVWGSFP